ncbi:MAG: BatA and WFA domain-containing protein [Gemmatimonadaceae bacterium]
MSFLQPLYLFLAGAVAVPLVLHLMRRRIETRIDFPAVLYLARAERENVKQMKIRNLLLMLLRILAVLFLALAAARPVGRLIGAGHVPTAVALVLDNSMSTSAIVDGSPLLTRLKRAAVTVVDGAAAGDRLWLVLADGRVVGGSKSVIRDALDRVEAIGGKGDLPAAVTRAAGLALAAGLPAREVAVVTDAQASTWSSEVPIGDVRVVVYAPAVTLPLNRAVVAADARPARWTPRGSVLAQTVGVDSATYRVSLGSRTLARGLTHAGEEIAIHAEPPERGWQRGVVELDPDELRADDARFFAVWIGGAPAVRPLAGAGPFVSNAVDALVQNGRVATGGEIDIGPADAVSHLPALILPPSDPVRLGAANRALERLNIAWRFGAAHRDETIVRGQGFDGVSAAIRYSLTPAGAAPAETLATAAGEPWIVAGEKYVVLGSAIDPGATSFPLRASFLPWFGDVLAQRLAGDATLVLSSAPGGTIATPAGVDALESDDGQSTPVTARTIAVPVRPGVYYLRQGAQRVGAVVVNSEPEESDLRRLPAPDLRSRLRARESVVVTGDTEWKRAVFDMGAQRPLQPSLLVLALLCLAAELFVVRRDDRPRTVKKAA